MIRLLIWASLAVPALTELYDYMNDTHPHKRLGTYAWTAIVIAITEFILAIKNGKVRFLLVLLVCRAFSTATTLHPCLPL